MKPLFVFLLWGFVFFFSSHDISLTRAGDAGSIFDSLDKHKRLNWLDILTGPDIRRDQLPEKGYVDSIHSPMNREQRQQIRKAKLAALLEKKFQEQRTRIEESTKTMQNRPLQNERQPIHKSPYLYPERRKNPISHGTTGIQPSVLLQAPTYRYRGTQSDEEIPKISRYAEEAKAGLRPTGLRVKAHPVFPKGSAPRKKLKVQSNESKHVDHTSSVHIPSQKTDLVTRLGSTAGLLSFDPSIIVNFTLLETSLAGKNDHKSISESKTPSSDFLTVVSRSLRKEKSNSYPFYNYGHDSDEENASKEDRTIFKRAKSIEFPSKRSSSKSKYKDQPMALYVAVNNPPVKLPQVNSTQDLVSIGKTNDDPILEGIQEGFSEFGPYSQGNDPSAGIDPSEVKLPDMDISQLPLPQSVRDSLRNYLEPLLASLRPLTKSVPGLPGLDYPILSVVPYTNFYCSNMPFPGFYADTEARCQTWHACDVDGRQATFLCPNGTIFNQALMVCDWWYNSYCLDAPFYYTLNKRLFGHLAQSGSTIPYNRITLELLDTIFL